MVAVSGPGTPFGDGAGKPLSIAAVDGDTIVFFESRNSGVKWPQPGDIQLSEIEQLYRARDPRGPSSVHEGGFHVAFADGAVWFLSDETPYEALQKFLTAEDAATHDRDEELSGYRLD